jgi:antitoxin component YwqK of YwqJK toxin-antitoxin module
MEKHEYDFLQGERTYFFPSGKIDVKQNLKKDKLDGIQYFYNENGKLYKIETYDTGKMISERKIN